MSLRRLTQIARVALCAYLVGWLAVTPSSRLGGPWWACGLMVCATVWLLDAIERLFGERR